MTTEFLDNKICIFKILLSWRFPRKTAFLDDFPLCPQGPLIKSEIFIFIVVSPSLSVWSSMISSSRLQMAARVFASAGRGVTSANACIAAQRTYHSWCSSLAGPSQGGGKSERPRSLLLSLGVPSRPSPGSDPWPVQV